MNTVGARIRKLREERGMKQEVIAAELDITQSSYGRLEKDDSRLTVPKLLKIAEVLNVSTSFLFGEKTAQIIHENNGDDVLAHIDSLTIIQYKEHIATLKEEINYLRSVLNKTL